MRRLLCLISFLFSGMLFAAIPNEVLSVWANEAIVATYTYDYQHFIEQQKNIAHYFSADGWMKYSQALQQAKIPETITKNFFFVTSVASEPPVIKVVDNSHFIATMPLLVLYKNAQFQQQQYLAITMQFSIASAGQGLRGFQIDGLQSVERAPTCDCVVTPDLTPKTIVPKEGK